MWPFFELRGKSEMEALDLFRENRFKECANYLDREQTGEFDTADWVRENNLLCCEFQDPLLSNSQYKSVQGRFRKLLEKYQGVAVRKDLVCCELRTAYNVCYLLLVDSCNGQQCLPELTSIIRTVLHRMSDRRNLSAVLEEGHDPLLEQMKMILSKNGPYSADLALLSCVWALHLIRQKDYTKALRLLEAAERGLDHTAQQHHLDFSNGFLVSSPVSNISLLSDSGANLRATVLFLQGLAHLMLTDYTSCLLTQNRMTGSPAYVANYLKAAALAEQCKWDLCLSELCDINLSSLELQEKAVTLNLIGYSLTKKAQYHNAAQHLRQALAADFTYLVPLYTLSMSYHHQGLVDAELEALNLLVTALEEAEPGQSSRTPALHLLKLIPNFSLRLIAPNISIIQALYCLASRCSQLHRYDIAAARYLDLIDRLTSHTSKVSDNKKIQLPSLPVIFQECASTLLKADRYTDAISICDKVLMKSSLSENQNSLLDRSGLFSSSHPTEDHAASEPKRKRVASDDEEEEEEEEEEETMDDHIRADWWCLKYKADALLKLGRHQEALECIDRVILSVEDLELVKEPSNKPPDKKRKRLSSDVSPDNAAVSSVSFVAECYHSKAVILTALSELREAFIYSRISTQLQPDNTVFVYDHCQLLLEQGRSLIAANTWLTHRGFDTHCDLMQLELQVRNKTNPPDMGRDDDTSVKRSETYQEMDHICLDHIRNSKQPQTFHAKIS